MTTKNISTEKPDSGELALNKSNKVIKDTKGKVSKLKDSIISENIETQEYNREKIVNMNINSLKKEYPNNWLEVLRKGMVYEINKFRNLSNKNRKEEDILPKMKLDTKLNIIAQNHSKDMAKNEKMDHKNSKGEYLSDRLEKAGLENYLGFENILMMTTSKCNIKTVVNTRINSKKGHKENMLKYTLKMGVGYDESKNHESYFTAIFCVI